MMLSAWPTYDSYKDSGVNWIGHIPSHWKQLANKHIFRLKKSLVGKRSSEYELLSLTLRGIVKRDMENPEGKFPAEFDTYQEVSPGDFVFCHFDVEETPRTVGLSDFFGMITGAYTVYSVACGIDPRFLLHFYICADTDKNMRSLYKGLRNTIPKDAFGAFKTPLPPIEEQREIVAYIDEASRKIEDAITIKQEQIALLRERRQILIQEAVTRGLNATAPMKDSGIDWIGQIPVHWEVENPKWLFSHRKERARKGEPQLAATQKYGVIPQSDFMDLEGRRVTQVFLDFDILKHVEAGDFVMSMRSFQGGLEYSEYTGCVSSAYVALEPGPQIFAPFYKYLFKSARYIEALQTTSNLVRDGQALRFDNFTMVILPVVPVEEQRAIAEYLDNALAKADQGIAIKEEQIAALKEYKSSLINAAVTGKIKVV